MIERIEYAACERGYEQYAYWRSRLDDAEKDAAIMQFSGINSRIIERTVMVSDWRELDRSPVIC